MLLYFSVGGRQHARVLMEYGVKNVLVSFAYRDLLVRDVEMFRMNGIKLFYDSGAFTCWSKGIPVDIEGYKRDLRQYDDMIAVAANVDVIPGQKGQKPTAEEVEVAGEQGWANFEMFRKEGYNKVIHIFHQGDDYKWLHRLLKECEYFGVSPSNDMSTKAKEQWLDQVFRTIDKVNPQAKTHAFGVTSEYLLTRYPWYSVDSSSFSQHAAYGACLIPPYNVVRFSDKKGDDPRHIDCFPEHEREGIKKLCYDRGFSFRQLKNNHFDRVRMNIISFRKLEDDINAKGHTQFYNLQPQLFDTTHPDLAFIPQENLEKPDKEEQIYERDQEANLFRDKEKGG